MIFQDSDKYIVLWQPDCEMLLLHQLPRTTECKFVHEYASTDA